jgi:amylosucrase
MPARRDEDRALTQDGFDTRLFALRLERSRADLFGMLERLYGERPDYGAFRAALLARLEAAWEARPEALKWLDLKRDLEPDWFQRPDMAGYVFYIDRSRGRCGACSSTSTISRRWASPTSTSCRA